MGGCEEGAWDKYLGKPLKPLRGLFLLWICLISASSPWISLYMGLRDSRAHCLNFYSLCWYFLTMIMSSFNLFLNYRHCAPAICCYQGTSSHIFHIRLVPVWALFNWLTFSWSYGQPSPEAMDKGRNAIIPSRCISTKPQCHRNPLLLLNSSLCLYSSHLDPSTVHLIIYRLLFRSPLPATKFSEDLFYRIPFVECY